MPVERFIVNVHEVHTRPTLRNNYHILLETLRIDPAPECLESTGQLQSDKVVDTDRCCSFPWCYLG